MPKPSVTIYTDGGCQPNPGPGGWAAIVLDGTQERELTGSAPDSTNNRMEITAALEALRSLTEPSQVELITDSTYLKDGITKWIAGWRRKGWLTAAKKPVKNQDLWRALDAATHGHSIQWRWTKGHAGNRWNERADELATIARGGGTAQVEPRDLPLAEEGAIHAFLGVSWSGKSRRGGWGCVLSFEGLEKELSGQVRDTTANAVHLVAAESALAALKRPLPVHLYTVSDYLQKGATTWLEGWKRNRWQTASGKPVASLNLWQDVDLRLDRLKREGHQIAWHLVSGDEPPPLLLRARELARGAQRG